MLKNFIKIAYRNLLKRKGFTIINLSGLSLGIAITIFIGLWIWDEISFNQYHANYDDIAVVKSNITYESETYTSEIHPTGLGTLLKSKYANYFDKVVLIRGRLEHRALSTEDKNFMQSGYFMQPEGAEMLELKMWKGDRNGLKDKSAILISRTLADKFFGQQDPLNQVITMDGNQDLKVAGVYEDLPASTTFHEASYFAPLQLYLQGWSSLNVWDNYNMFLYVQKHAKTSFSQASEAIKNAADKHMENQEVDIFLHAWANWQLDYENGREVRSDKFVYILFIGIIGVFVLVLACINFMNLSTAQAEKRAKEVGIMKSMGSSRLEMSFQFFSESILIALIAGGISITMVSLLLPIFNQITDKEIVLPVSSFIFWLLILVFTFFTGLLAGTYPALYLSSFSPYKVLKGTLESNPGAATFRKSLVVFQFAVSVSLIVGTMIIYQQIQMAHTRPSGYDRHGLITMPIRSAEVLNKFETLRNELIRSGAVDEMAAANYPITSNKGWNGGFNWPGKDPQHEPHFNIMHVTREYAETVGLDFVQGRGFSRFAKGESGYIIINESALKLMELEDPVGQLVTWQLPHFEQPVEYTIVGVVKDIIKESPFKSTSPVIITNSQREVSELFIRLNSEVKVQEAITTIKNTFRQVVPSTVFDYRFVNDEYNKKFAREKLIGNISGVFTIVAIFISCLGILGLAAYTAERRMKEIGIRKILGATGLNIIQLLTIDFTKLVLIAILISLPTSFWLGQSWLNNFAFSIELQWWYFAIAGLLALVIAWLTVGVQTYKAARINPIKCLKDE